MHHINTLTKSNIKIHKIHLPTIYWLPKLHKNPNKSRFILNSCHCSTTILSQHITSVLTAVKDRVIKYSEAAFSDSNVSYFWSIKSLLRSSKSCGCETFRVLSIFFRFFYFKHILATWSNKSKRVVFCYMVFQQRVETYFRTSDKVEVFSNKTYGSYTCLTCTELCDALTFLMENNYISAITRPDGIAILPGFCTSFALSALYLPVVLF